MTKKIKKILKTAKGVLFADPKILYEAERQLLHQSFYFAGDSGKADGTTHYSAGVKALSKGNFSLAGE